MAKTKAEELRHIQLKKKMLDEYRDILQEHAAKVACFCIENDIELEEGVELALEILGSYGRILLEEGIYDQAAVDYKSGIDKFCSVGKKRLCAYDHVKPVACVLRLHCRVNLAFGCRGAGARQQGRFYP